MKDVPIMLMPPAGNDAGKAKKGPTMKLVTRMWSGATFLRYSKEGDPLAAAGASSTLNWMSAKAHLADPKELTGLAKAMQDAKQGGALSEKERTFEQKTKEKKEGKEDKDDTKKTNENPEENALDTKEDTTDPNTATSLRSDSKMIPTMPGQPG